MRIGWSKRCGGSFGKNCNQRLTKRARISHGSNDETDILTRQESGPWGSKIKRLAGIAQAHRAARLTASTTPTCPTPIERVERAGQVSCARKKDGFLLVGSSMGGYVALVAAERLPAKGLFLLAPALYMPGYEKQSYHRTTDVEIVHGWSDGVIPVANSNRFAPRSGLHAASHCRGPSVGFFTRCSRKTVYPISRCHHTRRGLKIQVSHSLNGAQVMSRVTK
jgi:pimeloyl-ACP methyl ester carboxylesterase